MVLLGTDRRGFIFALSRYFFLELTPLTKGIDWHGEPRAFILLPEWHEKEYRSLVVRNTNGCLPEAHLEIMFLAALIRAQSRGYPHTHFSRVAKKLLLSVHVHLRIPAWEQLLMVVVRGLTRFV